MNHIKRLCLLTLCLLSSTVFANYQQQEFYDFDLKNIAKTSAELESRLGQLADPREIFVSSFNGEVKDQLVALTQKRMPRDEAELTVMASKLIDTFEVGLELLKVINKDKLFKTFINNDDQVNDLYHEIVYGLSNIKNRFKNASASDEGKTMALLELSTWILNSMRESLDHVTLPKSMATIDVDRNLKLAEKNISSLIKEYKLAQFGTGGIQAVKKKIQKVKQYAVDAKDWDQVEASLKDIQIKESGDIDGLNESMRNVVAVQVGFALFKYILEK